MDSRDGDEKWERRKRGFLCVLFFFFSWRQKVTTKGCAAMMLCTAVVGVCCLRFGLLTSDGTWRNCNCGPWATWLVLRSQIFNPAPWVGDVLCRVFVLIEYYLSWKKFCLSRWSACALLSVVYVFGFVRMVFANYVVIFNIPEDAFNFRKMPSIFSL